MNSKTESIQKINYLKYVFEKINKIDSLQPHELREKKKLELTNFLQFNYFCLKKAFYDPTQIFTSKDDFLIILCRSKLTKY